RCSSATTCASPTTGGRWPPAPTPTCGWPPGRRPAAPTGRRCCGPGPSRTRPTSSAATGWGPAGRSSTRATARSSTRWARRWPPRPAARRSSWPTSPPSGWPRCGPRCPSWPTGRRPPRRPGRRGRRGGARRRRAPGRGGCGRGPRTLGGMAMGARVGGGPHLRMGGMLGADPSQLGDARPSWPVVRRVLRFAHRYRWQLLAYLGVIVVAAVVQLVPPLLFREIIDVAIPRGVDRGDSGLLHLLAALAVVVAVASAVLAVVERWLSARIGEGVIFDLRVAVFDHVQNMPLAFFTRTQTGALTNRLNSDVIGAQRALTTTIGGVASNVITLGTTLVAMAALEWRLTLLSLVVLPLFIVPARRVGRRLQAVTRRQMDLNASMNTTMTERFSVAGALLVKLFGRREDESASCAARADGVRRNGILAALYGRTF